MDLFEAMETCRAVRYFKPDPVPAELIDKVLHAATRAPSPGNSQGWDFVVVTDPLLRERLGTGIAEVMTPAVHAATAALGGAGAIDAVERRMLDGALNLAQRLHEVPVHLIVAGPKVYPPNAPQEQFVWSALYPAVQNILLAARGLGLGTCLTAYQQVAEPLIRSTLGIPAEIYLAAYIPMGWPATNFGPLARKPLAEVVHHNGW